MKTVLILRKEGFNLLEDSFAHRYSNLDAKHPGQRLKVPFTLNLQRGFFPHL